MYMAEEQKYVSFGEADGVLCEYYSRSILVV